MKKRTKILVIILSILIAAILTFAIKRATDWSKMMAEGSMSAKKAFTPGTEAYKERLKMKERAEKYFQYIDKGKEYEKNGKYNLAVNEFQKAAELEKGSSYERWPRAELVDCYEKLLKYDLAIKELDWLIPRTNQEFVKGLQERRERLLKLIHQ